MSGAEKKSAAGRRTKKRGGTSPPPSNVFTVTFRDYIGDFTITTDLDGSRGIGTAIPNKPILRRTPRPLWITVLYECGRLQQEKEKLLNGSLSD